MDWSVSDVRRNRDEFQSKLHAIKQRADVVKAIEQGTFDLVLLDIRGREPYGFGHITTPTKLHSTPRGGGTVPVANLLPPAKIEELLTGVGGSSTEFLAIVAHEMRQPLNAGLAARQVLRSTSGTRGREHACQIIERQTVSLPRSDRLECAGT